MKDTYLSSRFQRVASRRGRKRAAAVAHKLLVVVYHVLDRRQLYEERGGQYLDRLQPTRLANRLEGLGLKMTIEPQTAV